MTSAEKEIALRIISPKEYSSKVIASLGPNVKVESKAAIMKADGLTTDDLVKYIKEYARLKDELLHTLRLLGIDREPRIGDSESKDYATALSRAQEQLNLYRTRHQELQSRIESLDRKLEDIRKQLSRISELEQTGFGPGDVASAPGEFVRILGRIPARRLEDARRALRSTLNDQAVLAAGKRAKDNVYVLVATPADKTSQTLQTLLLYDLVQTEIPKSEEPDLKQEEKSLNQRNEEIGRDLDSARDEVKKLTAEAGETLNRLADALQDSLLQLRGVLKMGETASVVESFARLPKAPSQKTLGSLQSMGALFETEA